MSSVPVRATPGRGVCVPDALSPNYSLHTNSSSGAVSNSCPSHGMQPLEATQHVRRMRGGSQSQLMGCSDGCYYVVKFPNNPQGSKTLANELLCARLARLLNLPVPPSAVVSVSEKLVQMSEEMYIETPRCRTPCEAGLCFGSRYPDPEMVIFDVWPKRRIGDIANISDFAGMMVFDIWTSNIDFRQVRYLRESPTGPWKVVMFDNGLAFRGIEWAFTDKPRLVVNPSFYVYEFVEGIASFDPWLTILEQSISDDDLRDAAREIPPQWYGTDEQSLSLLLEQLLTRRTRVRELICSLRLQSPKIFPNWKVEKSFVAVSA